MGHDVEARSSMRGLWRADIDMAPLLEYEIAISISRGVDPAACPGPPVPPGDPMARYLNSDARVDQAALIRHVALCAAAAIVLL